MLRDAPFVVARDVEQRRERARLEDAIGVDNEQVRRRAPCGVRVVPTAEADVRRRMANVDAREGALCLQRRQRGDARRRFLVRRIVENQDADVLSRRLLGEARDELFK